MKQKHKKKPPQNKPELKRVMDHFKSDADHPIIDPIDYDKTFKGDRYEAE